MDSSTPTKSAPSDVHSESPQPPVERTNPDQDHEYGCKFCAKKFSNKQALGGHQNAHKIERAMEKAAQEMHENHFGYFASGPSYTRPGPYHGSYNRSALNNFPYHSPQHGIRIGYNARPGLPLGYNYPYSPSRPMPGFRNVHPGWGAPRPGVPHFPSYHHHVQNRGPNVRFSTPRAGDSGSGLGLGSRPVNPNLSGFVRPRNGPGGNSNETNNRGNDDLQDEETYLDLSLKL